MSMFWRAVRVVKWAALAVFLFTCAFAPWGWTVTAAAAVLLAALWLRRELRKPQGRHAAVSRLEVRAGLPEIQVLKNRDRPGRHAA